MFCGRQRQWGRWDSLAEADVEIDNITRLVLCIFPKIYYCLDFIFGKAYHEINMYRARARSH